MGHTKFGSSASAALRCLLVGTHVPAITLHSCEALPHFDTGQHRGFSRLQTQVMGDRLGLKQGAAPCTSELARQGLRHYVLCCSVCGWRQQFGSSVLTALGGAYLCLPALPWPGFTSTLSCAALHCLQALAAEGQDLAPVVLNSHIPAILVHMLGSGGGCYPFIQGAPCS